MAKLSDMINRLVAEAFQKQMRLLGMVDDDETTNNDTIDPADEYAAEFDRRARSDARKVAGPHVPREQRPSRRFATKVQYVAVPIRANAGPTTKDARKRTIKALTPALAEVWEYISKHSPTTVHEIEDALQRGNKSVQSSVFGLRRAGLIASQPVEPE